MLSRESNPDFVPNTSYKRAKLDPDFFIEVSSDAELRTQLLEHPGFLFDSADELEKFLFNVLSRLKEATDNRTKKIVMSFIGVLISKAPADQDDGIWPTKYVRDAIEKYDELDNNDFMSHVITEILNSVGACYGEDIGRLWADLITQASRIRTNYPRMAKILKALATEHCKIMMSDFTGNQNDNDAVGTATQDNAITLEDI
jgi:hypothetical protein